MMMQGILGFVKQHTTTKLVKHQQPNLSPLHSEAKDSPSGFWSDQGKLLSTLKTQSKQDSTNNFTKRRMNLVSDNLLISTIIFSLLWFVCPLANTPFSYLLGSSLGTAYSYALGKQVATIGASEIDMETVSDGATGTARFAFLIVLFILLGKFGISKEGFLEPIPAIGGFFTYFISALVQSAKDYDE
tara:strand:+ start:161 stop:721 length:561 start_codon:yes stop_codon:yes gene_type:complete